MRAEFNICDVLSGFEVLIYLINNNNIMRIDKHPELVEAVNFLSDRGRANHCVLLHRHRKYVSLSSAGLKLALVLQNQASTHLLDITTLKEILNDRIL